MERESEAPSPSHLLLWQTCTPYFLCILRAQCLTCDRVRQDLSRTDECSGPIWLDGVEGAALLGGAGGVRLDQEAAFWRA